MAKDTKLKAERREGTGKGVARKLRAAGRIPAVVYGGEDETDHISLDAHDTEYLFHQISVDNTIVELEIEGQKEPVQTLVREIQTHPWKASLMHVDFLRIQKGVAVELDIPLHLVGTPVGVKEDGGVIEQVIHDLPIRCIPSDIPEVIEVDISGMELHDVLHVEDLNLPEGVEVMIAPERTVCSVALPRVSEEPEEGEEEAEEPEVIEGAAESDEGDERTEDEGDEG